MTENVEKDSYNYNTDVEIESPHLNLHKMRIISTSNRGRGVFAGESIEKDTLVDISPVLLFNKDEYTNFGKHTALDEYTFIWPDRSGRMGLALGLGSIFNHNRIPNVKFSINTKNLTIEFKTTRFINKDEEMFISYGSESKLWWTSSEIDDECKDLSELEFLQSGFGTI